jgi:hypothetical protein
MQWPHNVQGLSQGLSQALHQTPTGSRQIHVVKHPQKLMIYAPIENLAAAGFGFTSVVDHRVDRTMEGLRSSVPNLRSRLGTPVPVQ